MQNHSYFKLSRRNGSAPVLPWIIKWHRGDSNSHLGCHIWSFLHWLCKNRDKEVLISDDLLICVTPQWKTHFEVFHCKRQLLARNRTIDQKESSWPQWAVFQIWRGLTVHYTIVIHTDNSNRWHLGIITRPTNNPKKSIITMCRKNTVSLLKKGQKLEVKFKACCAVRYGKVIKCKIFANYKCKKVTPVEYWSKYQPITGLLLGEISTLAQHHAENQTELWN